MDYIPPKPPNYSDVRDYKADQVQEFLKKISALESSSGRNLAHKEMDSGVHKGTAAVGEYGLMPLTAQDLDRQYGVDELDGLSPEEVKAKLKENPGLAKRLVETMASQLLKGNNSEEAAYKWEHGPASKATPDQINKSERIRRFRVLNEK